MPTSKARTLSQHSLPFEILEDMAPVSVIEIIGDDNSVTDYWYEANNGDFNRIRFIKNEDESQIVLEIDRYDARRIIITSSLFSIIEGEVWEIVADRNGTKFINYNTSKIWFISKDVLAQLPSYTSLPVSTTFDKKQSVILSLIEKISIIKSYYYNNPRNIIKEIVEHMKLGDIDKWVLDKGIIEIVSLLNA